MDKTIINVIQDTAKKLGVNPAPATMLAIMGAKPESITNVMITQSNALETKKAEKENPIIDGKPTDYTPIESILHDMMQENTGTHMLDSGGAYGRSWQRNRAITDFRKEHPFTVNVDDFSPDETYLDYNGDMFTLLSNVLDRDDEVEHFEKMFYKWWNQSSRDEGVDDFPATEYGLKDYKCVHSFNTYNDGDAYLSGTFQGYVFTHEEDTEYWVYADEPIVAIRIHGGCDVRGGYTEPKFFKPAGYEVYSLFDYNRVSAQCKCTLGDADDGGFYWSWQRNYNWEPKQQTMEEKPIDIWNNIGNREFPPFWKTEVKPEGEECGWYAGDRVLRCQVCGEVVGFHASLGEY